MEPSPRVRPPSGFSLAGLQEYASPIFDRWTALSESSRNRLVWLVALLIAVLHAGMAITAADRKSPVYDEPAHLTAGYSYWIKNDFRLDPENGNLPARWAALPLLMSGPGFVPLSDRGWCRGEQGRTGHQFFYEVGNNPDFMLRQARMMMSIFGLGLCLLIFRCAREFFGLTGGLLAEIIAAFDPTLLANSALVASDVAAAFFFTAAVWTTWKLLNRITPWSLALAALSLSGLFLTKFSAPIVLPVLGLVALVRILSRNSIQLEFRDYRRVLETTLNKTSAVGATGAVFAAFVVLAIWCSYSFRYAAWTDHETQSNHSGSSWHWDKVLEDDRVLERAVGFACANKLLPEAYLYGFAYVRRTSENRPSFLDNHWSIVGFRSFFPKTFLYKTPVPFLCFLALGLAAGVVRWNKHRGRATRELVETIRRDIALLSPFLIFLAVYGGFALTSHLDIGHRHILPIYPALFIVSGAAAFLILHGRRLIGIGAIAILLSWQIGESVIIRPNYLAYFNQIAGGPASGYKHLVDSSLDWGQDLPAVKAWLDQQPSIKDRPLYLSYFGTADPRWYEIKARLVPDDRFTLHNTPAPLGQGIYLISATNLQSVYGPEMGPWCLPYEANYQIALGQMGRYYQTDLNLSAPAHLVANDENISRIKNLRTLEKLRFARLCAYLRQREPIAQIGHSILVFDLSSKEVELALHGPPAECRRDIAVIGL